MVVAKAAVAPLVCAALVTGCSLGAGSGSSSPGTSTTSAAVPPGTSTTTTGVGTPGTVTASSGPGDKAGVAALVAERFASCLARLSASAPQVGADGQSVTVTTGQGQMLRWRVNPSTEAITPLDEHTADIGGAAGCA